MALKLQPEEKKSIREYYLKDYNQRKIAKLIKRTSVTINKYINEELKPQLEKENKELDIAYNQIKPYEERLKSIENNAYRFIDDIFADSDLSSISPELKFQAKVKLIEVLNKSSK